MITSLFFLWICSDIALGTSWKDHVTNSSWYDASCRDDANLDQVEVFTTDAGVAFVRTPDDQFTNLAEAGFPFKPKYVTVEGLRMHFVDEGPENAEVTILCLHGQPTWSYLYRKMIPKFAQEGFRVIAPDLIGMGRSDKPLELNFHKFLTHVRLMKAFISALSLQNITAFVQDWGSMIGIRIIADMPSMFSRVVVANGGLRVIDVDNSNPFTMPEDKRIDCAHERTFMNMVMERRRQERLVSWEAGFDVWIKFAMTNPTWNPSDLFSISASEKAAYHAPFLTILHCSGPRMLPSMVTGFVEPEIGNRAAFARLGNFTQPWLQLAGERDRNLGSPENQQRFINHVPGAKAHSQEHKRYPTAGHFIQDDAGEEVADDVVAFIRATSGTNNDGSSGTRSITSSSRTSGPAANSSPIFVGGHLAPVLTFLSWAQLFFL